MSGEAARPLSGDPAVVDMRQAAFWADPHPQLARAREQAPIALSPGGQKLLLRHADVEAALSDPRMRTLGTGLLANVHVSSGPLYEWWRLVMFNTDPPQHTRLRRLVSRVFTPRAVERVRPRIAAWSEQLLGELEGRDEVDLVESYAHRLPGHVTCELLGVPEALHREVIDHTAELGLVFSARLPPELRERCEKAVRALSEIAESLFDERDARPREDLLSALLQADEAGDRLRPEERVAMVVNLLFAGHDTTRGMLSIGLALLLRHAAQAQALRREPALAARAVDEVLRFEPPVFGSLRQASEPLSIAGVRFEPGEPINTIIPSATRDPRRYADPDVFDIRREGSRPLAFGWGTHACLGASLARAEGEIGLPAFLRRFPRAEFVREPAFVAYAAIRRLDAVRVRLGPPVGGAD